MKSLLVVVLLSVFLEGWAQVKISGTVIGNKNKPLTGASITLRDTYDGGTSDSLGNFSFTSIEQGSKVLDVTIAGYHTFQINIILGSSPVLLNILLKELITELNAVVITAGSFEASDKKKGAVLTALDIVTTASANADIISALNTLPGTQQVGESEGLFVRGGSATESRIFIDGQLVNNFFYSSLPGLSTRGRFSPFLFKGTVFSAGGYSALYGQALSSALILESKDLPDRTEADLSLSVIGLGGGLQTLAKNKRSSWGISYSYTNLALAFAVNKQAQDFYSTPVYHEGDVNFRIKTANGGFIKYYGYVSQHRMGFRKPDIDSISLHNAFDIKNLNTYQNITWKENLGNTWKLNAGLSYSTNKDEINNELQDGYAQVQRIMNPPGYASKNFDLDNKANYVQVRLMLEKRLGGLNTLRFGGDYFYSNEKTIYTVFNGGQSAERVKNNLSATYAETDFYITKDLAAKLGSRVEYSNLLAKWNLAPRASLAYKFKGNGQLSIAYGIFYQNPDRKYLPAPSNQLDYAKASHYIVQYQRLKDKRSFRTELFYKKYQDLFKTTPDSYGREIVTNNNGHGYAKGIEFFWRDKTSFKSVDYWVSYSYLDTKRDYQNFPMSMTPNFAATHTMSLVVKKFSIPLKTGFNASYSFASGRPYYHLKYDTSADKYEVEDNGRTIPYNSLAFSLNYLPNLGKTNNKSFIVWVLSVTNVLAQRQVFGYNYGTLTDRKEAITPPSKRFVFLGCFMSFGIDRTQDAINLHL